MKIASVLLMTVLAAAANSGVGFSLLPAANCVEVPDRARCTAARPKHWTSEERHVVQQTMRRLAARELVQGLLVAARENGYHGFRRYATDTKQDPDFGHVPTFSPGFVHYSSKVIGLTDAYFQTANVRDPLSDYRFGDLILVHELAHAADDRKGSTAQGFTTVTGWISRDNQWRYANRINYSAYLGVYADTLTLYATGRYDEAWTRDRAFATTLKFPLPTIQSLASPDESFADILAHLIVDPRASTYLHPSVVSWFQATVFPTLTDSAQRFKAVDYDLF